MRPLLLSCSLLALTAGCAGPDDTSAVASKINGGIPVPNFQLEEVGRLSTAVGNTSITCSGTLITDEVVLTAAHCVCPDVGVPPSQCSARSSFRLVDVLRKDVWSTPVDESLTRGTVVIGADVVVHPSSGNSGWGYNDFALLMLDTPASTLTREVVPRGVAPAYPTPHVGDIVTVAGFGPGGDNPGGDPSQHCDLPSAKRRTSTPLDFIVPGGNGARILRFDDALIHMCHGDSGGPMMNANGKLIGVASNGNMYSNSGYGATYPIADWIESYTGLDLDPVCPAFDASNPDPNFCSTTCPCDEGEGHCTDGSECAPGLLCVHFAGASWGLPAGYSVCQASPEL